MNAKKLPSMVTSLDLIKSFALICMVIDHIGFFFFPNEMWFRAVGRFGGAPVWFFLIGYAQSRDVPNMWLIGATLLVIADFLIFQNVFPLNVLVTLILLRLFIDKIMGFVLQSRYMFGLVSVLLAFCYMASNMAIEYGTLAVLCAMAGYMTRHKGQIFTDTFVTKYDYRGFLIFITVANAILQTAVFGFDSVQFMFVLVGVALFTATLVYMKPMTFSQLGQGMLAKVIQYTGRHTLEIYVAHLLVFMVLGYGLRMVGIL